MYDLVKIEFHSLISKTELFWSNQMNLVNNWNLFQSNEFGRKFVIIEHHEFTFTSWIWLLTRLHPSFVEVQSITSFYPLHAWLWGMWEANQYGANNNICQQSRADSMVEDKFQAYIPHGTSWIWFLPLVNHTSWVITYVGTI